MNAFCRKLSNRPYCRTCFRSVGCSIPTEVVEGCLYVNSSYLFIHGILFLFSFGKRAGKWVIIYYFLCKYSKIIYISNNVKTNIVILCFIFIFAHRRSSTSERQLFKKKMSAAARLRTSNHPTGPKTTHFWGPVAYQLRNWPYRFYCILITKRRW
jgi:hypothetical protein